jgi:hypothetical protein
MTNIKAGGKNDHEFVNEDFEGYGYDLFQTFWRD